MALARLSVKNGKSGKGASHSEYIAREGKYSKYTERGEKLEYKDCGNLPSWAEENPTRLWQEADAREKGYAYKEYEISLPRELNEAQRKSLVQDFVKEELGDKYPYQLAIHVPIASDGKENPHCHLMFFTRPNDGIDRDPEIYFKSARGKAAAKAKEHPELYGAKKDFCNQTREEGKKQTKALRDRWEKKVNQHLKLAGSEERIDMRSLEEQGKGFLPVKNLLPSECKGSQGVINLQAVREARGLQRELADLERSNEEAQKEALAVVLDFKEYARKKSEERERKERENAVREAEAERKAMLEAQKRKQEEKALSYGEAKKKLGNLDTEIRNLHRELDAVRGNFRFDEHYPAHTHNNPHQDVGNRFSGNEFRGVTYLEVKANFEKEQKALEKERKEKVSISILGGFNPVNWARDIQIRKKEKELESWRPALEKYEKAHTEWSEAKKAVEKRNQDREEKRQKVEKKLEPLREEWKKINSIVQEKAPKIEKTTPTLRRKSNTRDRGR